ncbi:hypothetical protein BDV38DRAFT_164443 [Aspergillus pseudotamarii]|uniref:Hybrid NRPS/PKS enzyme n=1 Tax=Aspergillus pseudotamarii TaxID=132259 RepID=A0A5N6SKZ0_ASPPS|nr:uncharacterized protein BDV38DRAFT_164443 [Aspergillus pseudotamarii]KAE8134361.1 hypothetical protein BDV38DRAFT_164443 [Aspergillus pseudotamarii]
MGSLADVRVEPIAIVGSACRFPGGANSPSKLWDLLRSPRDVLMDFPPSRLRLSNFYHTDGEHHGSTNVTNKSYLLTEDPNVFDAAFFNLNGLEAQAMDPQHRILLETVYEALERGGCSLDGIQGTKTSVFVGVMNADYYDIQLRDTETMARYNATGTARSIISNRISYFFDLKGASMTIDTACSSSLVALHQAVLSLQNREASASIVAGANLLLDPTMYIAESNLHMLSPEARSRMWDKDANGYARGEGFAAVYLKPLSAALRDGDEIECIIRGTGVNSDGRTKGITMPSSVAQTELIRDTYRRAGLDPSVDRPQFVECHGTGTAAGDPVEARAVHDAFFPPSSKRDNERPVYAGSIKTIIGHLEGCAGLAGVLKASLALQNRIIPPNMHFKDLSPSVKPFYGKIQIPKQPIPWPESTTLRASVNSFGFGGTNAHVILEGYHRGGEGLNGGRQQARLDSFVGPLLFSGNTQTTLRAMIKEYFDYLSANPSLDLEGLARALEDRRSRFPVRAFFSGSNREALLKYMGQALISSEGSDIGTRALASSDTPGLLGIFTGQGAQWATMGKALIRSCPLFRVSIETCEESLVTSPDPPSWSLMQELLADDKESRIGQAAFSQPLCTALQIALVDLCSAAAITFDAVVGHSSGEIAATYAAGILSAKDAIRIAYYRGLYAKLAQGPDGQPGAMMAVGLSMEGAMSFIAECGLYGKVCLAASNSPSSITLSGDRGAIVRAKGFLDERKVFARQLQVDTAYHSHHMLSCADAYLKSLEACKIKPSLPRPGCVWVSSVRGDIEILEKGDFTSLNGQYWVDNMVKPVLFSQAVECSLWAGGPFDMVLELGPHPALKGPATQALKSALGTSLPYAGIMRRATNEVEAFSGAIGYVWSHLTDYHIDFASYREAFFKEADRAPAILKDLPSYPWQHDKAYWKESRISRQFRLRHSPLHELLGRRAPGDSDSEMRWRNVLRLSELEWIRGHEFQGQALFPAMGYIAMALEASTIATKGHPIRLVDIEDFHVLQAVVLEQEHPGVEIVFSLKQTGDSKWDFDCYTCSDEWKDLTKTSTGRLILYKGEGSASDLPSRPKKRANLSPLDREMFYRKLSSLGLNYHGLFKPQSSFQRSQSYATGSASWSLGELGQEYVVHPAVMDVGLHSIFVAFASPVSHELWATYLPVAIDRLSFNPNISLYGTDGALTIEIDTFITESSSSTMKGDVYLLSPDATPSILIEGVRLQSFTEAKAPNDRLLFSKVVWGADIAHGFSSRAVEWANKDQFELCDAMERTSLFFLQRAFAELTPCEIEQSEPQFRHLRTAFQKAIEQIKGGVHKSIQSEWLGDSWNDINSLRRSFESSIDLEMMHAIGQCLPGVIRGRTSLLEVMMRDNLLNRFYTDGRLFVPLNLYVAKTVKAMIHKNPRMKILEIGAGTGATTKAILDTIGDKFDSYTYTDISPGFFAQTQEKFVLHRQQMRFQTLDIERDTVEQGLERHSYDLVVAANVLHATSHLHETMGHVRSLLRPGGYLLIVEVTGETLQLMYVMGGFPGWWLGVDDGRTDGPGIPAVQWEGLLQMTGFSGIEATVSDLPIDGKHSCSAFVSQAIDDKLELFRDPLPRVGDVPIPDPILILGGGTLPVAKLVTGIRKLLKPFRRNIEHAPSVDHLAVPLEGTRSVICLSELDKPLLSEALTDIRLSKLQAVLGSATNVLWLTRDRLTDHPHANMISGLGRTLQFELPDINIQFLDIRSGVSIGADQVVIKFLQLSLANSPEYLQEDVQWKIEPELSFDGEEWQIPRIIPYEALNDRYNAARRQIMKPLDASKQPVELEYFDGRIIIREGKRVTGTSKATVRLRTVLATRLVSSRLVSFFLCMGVEADNGRTAVAITSKLGSLMDIPSTDAWFLPQRTQCDPALLYSIAGQVLAAALSFASPRSGSVMLYEPTEALAEAIVSSPSWVQEQPYFITSRHGTLQKGWTYIHPRVSHNIARDVLPGDTAALIDCSNDCPHWAVPPTIGQLVPVASCVVEYLTRTPSTFRSIIEQAYSESLLAELPSTQQFSASILPVGDSAGQSSSLLSYPNIVNFECNNAVLATVAPLDCTGLFSSDKTYWMIGLNSELGLSICRWMIVHGARHIVITSRSGKVDAQWLDEIQSTNGNVKVYPMDVTDRKAMHSVHQEIVRTMPPIAGVCNGAMVLSDKLFMNMKAEDMNKVLRPKVDGSIYLDELFSTAQLDFFILFSSLASVVGNGGQCNYHAANMFMTSLVSQRRSRGLAASVIDIGLVVDVGYVARAGQSLIDHLVNLFYTPLSESDIHKLFAEAVMASPVDSGLCPDIIMGVEPVHDLSASLKKPPWYNNPIFSHLRPGTETSSQDSEQSSSTSANIRDQVSSASSAEEGTDALLRCFVAKLEAMLSLATNSINVNVPLLDIGVDSLLAVEIRQWFLTKLYVDIPVLKVLSGDTVVEICAEAIQKFAQMSPSVFQGKPSAASKIKQATASPPKTVREEVQSTSRAGLLPPDQDNDNSSDSGSQRKSGDSTSSGSGTRTPTSIDEYFETKVDKLSRSGPMSYAQSRLWFQQQLVKDPTALNIVVRFDVKGYLDVDRLAAAVTATVNRHDALHSVYFAHLDTQEPLQGVIEASGDIFQHVKVHDGNAANAIFLEMQSRHWDLVRGDVFKVTLLTFPTKVQSLIIAYHHIVLDGFSWHVYLRDLSMSYQQLALPPGGPQALDLALVEAQETKNGEYDAQLEFWREELSPVPETLPLLPFSSSKVRQDMQSFQSTTATRELPFDILASAKAASQRLRVTPFHFHLAVAQVLLYELTNTGDLCIGVTDANRTNRKFAETVGFFLNLVPLRLRVKPTDSFTEVLRRASKKALSAMEHSGVPIDVVLRELNIQRSLDHSPLFQVVFNYRVGDMLQVPFGGGQLELHSSIEARSPYDVVFNVTQCPGGTSYLQVTSRDALYAPEVSGVICDMYIRLLENFAGDTFMQIQDGLLNDKSEPGVGLGPRLEFGWPRTMSELFSQRAATDANSIAVKDCKGPVSYAELQQQVADITQDILGCNPPPNARVAVCIQPSRHTIAAMLATLAAGCVYVPIDITLPEARRRAILDSCRPSVILCDRTSSGSVDRLAPQESRKIDLGDSPTRVTTTAMPKPVADDPAFLLYSSGSTGIPKGILLPQKGYMNYLASKGYHLSLGQEIVLQQSSVGFDMSIAQIGNALAHGGTVVVVPQSVRGDPVATAQLMLQEKVTFMIGTPSEYLMLLQHGGDYLRQYRDWRHACLGGESVTEPLKREFRRLSPNCPNVTDCYGPTEISAATSFNTLDLHRDAANEYPTVGRPIPNSTIYILGENGELVPPGFVGEICIGGVGVALGYWNLPDLDKQKFIHDPFASSADRRLGWTRLYKTGDRGRLGPDGGLIFMGRLDGDTQIKLRGLRIDLEEVANSLLQVAAGLLSDTVVSVRGDPEFLVAHAVPARGQKVTNSDLESFKKSLPLPQYMCPAAIVLLDRLPTTPNGKVDRKALQDKPLPTQPDSSFPTETLSVAEGELRLVWQDVLPQTTQTGRIDPQTDFFMAGGNSLLLAKLQAAIKNTYGLSIALKDLYRCSTLGRMATLIDAEKKNQPFSETIDWEEETRVPGGLARGQRSREPKTTDLHIALTGSTGFLGVEILKALLEQPTVSKIHCLAVDAQHGQSLPKSHKIVIYPGSLNVSALGLSTREVDFLKSTVDALVHAGANGHCLNNYFSLRMPNLGSTRFLTELALSRGVPLHYVSSNRVALLSGDVALPPGSVSAFPPPKTGSDGFTASKWASERYLENVAEATGLDVCIHRPCALTGDQAPSEDALNAILRFSVLMKVVPQFPNVRGFFDFEKVGVVAANIVKKALQSVQVTRDHATLLASFTHHSSGVKVPVDKIQERMQDLYGGVFGRLALADWVQRARTLGIEPLVASYLEAMESRGEEMAFPFLGMPSD